MRYRKIFFLIVLCNFSLSSQMLLDTDTTYVKMSKKKYLRLVKYNDSISKIKIQPDTISIYKIKRIKKKKGYFIIEAERKVNKTTYYYRIKSEKCKKTNCRNKIKKGDVLQLDLRDYNNYNQRLHFIPGAAFNMITHMGSPDFNLSPFDVIEHWDESMTRDDFNIAINLEGLCLKER